MVVLPALGRACLVGFSRAIVAVNPRAVLEFEDHLRLGLCLCLCRLFGRRVAFSFLHHYVVVFWDELHLRLGFPCVGRGLVVWHLVAFVALVGTTSFSVACTDSRIEQARYYLVSFVDSLALP